MRNVAKLKSPDYVKPNSQSSGVAKNAGIKTEQFSSLKNGVAMEYAERGSGDNVIIFLHGYVDSWFVWSDVMSLMPDDYHIYAVSHRGHGDTSKPDEGYEMSDFAKDLLDFMDQQGIAKADIAGHSMGGVIAQRFVLDYPDRVRRLILVDTGANLKGNAVIVEGFGPYVDTLHDPVTEQEAIDAQITSYHKKYDPEYFATQIVETLKVPLIVWKKALSGLSKPDYRAEITSIQHPTLIVWATADDIFPWVDQQDLLTIPNSQLESLQNIGHGAYWEEPEKFTNKLVKFLRNN